MKVLSAFVLVLPLLPIVSATETEYPECESNGGVIERIGDGRCDYEGDHINNIEECGYDGGDCCVCDCEDGEYACGADRYSCLDPASTCHYPDCTANGGELSWLPDGWCDLENNIEECGYDGGDCCGCECINGLYRKCGIAGYDCEHPTSACTGQFVSYLGCFSDPQDNRVFEFKSSDSAMTAEVCSVLCSGSLFYGTQYSTECWCGDNADYDANGPGVCDMSCSGDSDETCGGRDALSVYVNGVTPNDPTFPECESNGGVVERIGDGRCDYEGDHINNIEECGYDGGDCCVCDCEDGEYACGADRYSCLDPASTCHYPDCTANGGELSWLPDGWCDLENNIEECGYDGGDCCGCECINGLYRKCGIAGYDCEHPTSACTGQFVSYLGCFSDPQDNRVFEFKSSDSAMTAEVCSVLCSGSLFYGTQYSTECWCGDNADYDANGPGVCDMSCSGDSDETCGGRDALSVYVNGVTPNDPTFPECESNGGVVERIGDGRCDYEGDHINNIEECGYDGGDCCVCDCEDGEYACGADRYSCLDPASTCHYPDCTANGGELSWLPDGWCDLENNIEECGYDGGDCCGCECINGLYRKCGIAGYDCEHPTSACTGQFVSYLGCFSDPQDNRVFEFKSSDSAMTAEVCSVLCSGSLFYGTQYSTECWCGDNADYDANGPGVCDMSCSGDSDETCGGRDALSVYVNGVTPNDPIFRGCYSDPADNRIFELVVSSQDMTSETCMGHCSAYQYYGTQYSTECWCGDVNAQYSVNGEGVCDMRCSGNSEETCGGYFSMSVYEAI